METGDSVSGSSREASLRPRAKRSEEDEGGKERRSYLSLSRVCVFLMPAVPWAHYSIFYFFFYLRRITVLSSLKIDDDDKESCGNGGSKV